MSQEDPRPNHPEFIDEAEIIEPSQEVLSTLHDMCRKVDDALREQEYPHNMYLRKDEHGKLSAGVDVSGRAYVSYSDADHVPNDEYHHTIYRIHRINGQLVIKREDPDLGSVPVISRYADDLGTALIAGIEESKKLIAAENALHNEVPGIGFVSADTVDTIIGDVSTAWEIKKVELSAIGDQ